MLLRDVAPMSIFTFTHAMNKRLYLAIKQCDYTDAVRRDQGHDTDSIFYLDLEDGELFTFPGDNEVTLWKGDP